MNFAARLRADARRTILEILAADRGYSANHEILRTGLDSIAAISLSEKEVIGHLAWLENAGLITTEIVGHYTLATITRAGLSIAEGRDWIAGVSRRRPDA